jgi:hypothetical protein
MRDIHTDHRSGFVRPLTGACGIGAFVWETLEKPGVGAAIEWLGKRGRSGQLSVFPTGECQSRWVHAASLESNIRNINSAMEQDNATVE